MPELVGGSADLTGSNNTHAKGRSGHAADFSGNYMHYGVREHGMASAMTGLALHGGVIPYRRHVPGLRRLCRPAIRLAALMGCASSMS